MIDLEALLEKPAQRIANFWQKHVITILLLLIFNLLIVVILMSITLAVSIEKEDTHTLAIEFEPSPESEKATYQEKDEALYSAAKIRNIAVNVMHEKQLNAGLSDDKNTNAQEIYEEMQRIRSEIAANRANTPPELTNSFGDVDMSTPTQLENKQAVYQGPSVLNYYLDERTPVHLPVPAYQCETGGIVVVIIHVNKTGAVINAGINKQESHNSECLQTAALRAALQSRFDASPKAPDLQVGLITYQFVKQ